MKTEKCGALRASFINMRRRHHTFQFFVFTFQFICVADTTLFRFPFSPFSLYASQTPHFSVFRFHLSVYMRRRHHTFQFSVFTFHFNNKGHIQSDTPFIIYIGIDYKGKNASKIPAATAEPITPATFGPIACINKKLLGLYC